MSQKQLLLAAADKIEAAAFEPTHFRSVYDLLHFYAFIHDAFTSWRETSFDLYLAIRCALGDTEPDLTKYSGEPVTRMAAFLRDTAAKL